MEGKGKGLYTLFGSPPLFGDVLGLACLRSSYYGMVSTSKHTDRPCGVVVAYLLWVSQTCKWSQVQALARPIQFYFLHASQ